MPCLSSACLLEAWNMAQRSHVLRDGWKFFLGDHPDAPVPALDDHAWNTLSLPHDFSISQPFSDACEGESGFLPGGVGWYRRTLVLPPEFSEKRLILAFDGVYQDCAIYCNGRLLGEHHYGYTHFALDLTDSLCCDGFTPNVLAIRVENPVPTSRWYSGSGIFRPVTLEIRDPIHVSPWSIRVETPEEGTGKVRTTFSLENHRNDKTFVEIRQIIGDRMPVSDYLTVPSGKSMELSYEFSLRNIRPWSCTDPHCYTLITEIWEGMKLLDRETTVFGFRWAKFTDQGFFLNGKPLKLNGVCLHADQGALGSAAEPDAIARQLKIMKNMGVNAIRTSHHAPARCVMDLCNRMGLLVLEDAFDYWNLPKNGNSGSFHRYFSTPMAPENGLLGNVGETWGEFVFRSMIRRDRNDPCLILWALTNEVQEGAGISERFPEICEKLLNILEEEDPTRPATFCDNTKGQIPILAQLARLVHGRKGIVGYNYANGSQLDAHRPYYGTILNSETASAVHSRGVYSSMASCSDCDGGFHLTSYDTSTVGWGKTAQDTIYTTIIRDFVPGQFVWTGFDYIGEPTPWNGVSPGSITGKGPIPNSSYFGIVETTGFPKDSYWLYRSQWNRRETTLHLVTAWDPRNALFRDGRTPVMVYSSAPRVCLYRNGLLMGEAIRKLHKTPVGHIWHSYAVLSHHPACKALSGEGPASLYAAFWLEYEAGTVSARAFDAQGQEIFGEGTAEVSTPGIAQQLSLHVTPNGKLFYGEISVEDSKGHLDTMAQPLLTVTLSHGRILGVDNGDQATTEKYQQPSVLLSDTKAQIRAFHGKALVIFQGGGEALSVTVSGDGFPAVRQVLSTGKTAAQPICGPVEDRYVREDRNPGHFFRWEGDTLIRIHAIPTHLDVQPVEIACAEGQEPKLPATVPGILPDGSPWGFFPVQWQGLSGKAQVFPGEWHSVSAKVRRISAEISGRVDLIPQAAQVRTEGKKRVYRWDTVQIVHGLSMDRADGVELLYSLNNVEFFPLEGSWKPEGDRMLYVLSSACNPIAIAISWKDRDPGAVTVDRYEIQ